MPYRFTQVCSIAGILTLSVFLGLSSIGCNQAPESTGKISDSEIVVPNGKPQKILDFIKELRSRNPKFTDHDAAFAYSRKVMRAMIEAGDKILAQKADDSEIRQGTTLKLTGTISRASILDRESKEFTELADNALNVVLTLRNDPRAAVVEVANQFWVAARALNFGSLSNEERTKLAEDAIRNVKDLKLAHEAAAEAGYVADQFVDKGQPDVAASMFSQLAELLKASSDKQTISLAMDFFAKSRRLQLIGSPLELEGHLLDGDTLNWESYRGKVVLVDFWATWCGPCVADLPRVKALYDKYHSNGFEVIGVSLDRSYRDLKSFVTENSIPWPQLFDKNVQESKRQPSPMSTKYNVSVIPTAFLVDAEGKVVSVEARAGLLDPMLKKMLGLTAENGDSSADASETPR